MQAFRADWCSHLPVAELCIRWTITKDQVVRLRDLWDLPLRTDRKKINKPTRQRDPSPAEIAKACQMIRATWDEATELERRVVKPTPFSMRPVSLEDAPESWRPADVEDVIKESERQR